MSDETSCTSQLDTMSHEQFAIGALIFQDFEVLDIFGPLELLGLLGPHVLITMLAPETGHVSSSQSPKCIADGVLGDVPGLDLLLVPGGMGTRTLIDEAEFIESLRRQAIGVPLMASICTGSALLARTGLLDGVRATSNKLAFDWVVKQGPRVNWVREARWVENGRYFTSSGIAAGMDMTLGLIENRFGSDARRKVERRAEYTGNHDKTQDPFA